jgi:ribosomal protein S6--L-glutamate ligase
VSVTTENGRSKAVDLHQASPGARVSDGRAGCAEGRVIALERRLRHCRQVLTLGVRPNLESYPEEALAMIQVAEKIYFPSVFYADLFDAMGKSTFPSAHTYRYVQDKIKQTALFKLLGIPHPRTHVYYGRHQQRRIRSEFAYPFVAKVPRGSALGRGVYLIRDDTQLDTYLAANRVAYIQQYLPIDRDIRAVVIGDHVVHAYWRVAAADDFRTNVSAGGRILLDGVPREALELARQTARKCGWDDVGLDICCTEGRWYVLEGNMKYGKAGFRAAGIDYYHLMDTLIANGTI